MAPGALAIARRHDPYLNASADARDREDVIFAARLRQSTDRRSTDIQTAQAKTDFHLRASPAAKPFRVSNALDGTRELECLTQAVYYEARGEGSSGQAAVAQVVLNRVRHPSFPKSVCGVVFQGASNRSCQFSFTCNGSLHRTREVGAWRRAQQVAARALDGYVVAGLGNATHFHTTGVSPGWGGMIQVASVGQHIFYRLGGRRGAPGAFRQDYAPSASVKTVYASLAPSFLTHVSDEASAPQASDDQVVAEAVAQASKVVDPKDAPNLREANGKAHDAAPSPATNTPAA